MVFSTNLTDLYVGSANGNIDILDAETGSVKKSWVKAHGEALSSFIQVNESLIATGDDGGFLKLWDVRQPSPVGTEQLNDDYISDMTVRGNLLLTTSGDGKLSVFDCKHKKVVAQSDDVEEPLTSLAIIKNGRKVVVGTEGGVLGIFSWGNWGDVSDRLPGHEDAVTCMLKVDESVVLTGSEDGYIRAVSIQPHRFMACEARHGAMGVSALKWFRDPRCVCSSSAFESDRLLFWDAEALLTDSAGSTEDSEESEEDDSDEDEDEGAVAAEAGGKTKGEGGEATPPPSPSTSSSSTTTPKTAPAPVSASASASLGGSEGRPVHSGTKRRRVRRGDTGQKAKHRKRNAGNQTKSRHKSNREFFSDL